MSDFFPKLKAVQLQEDKDLEYYNNFKITLKSYKDNNTKIEWYLKTETDEKVMLFLKELLEFKNKVESQIEFNQKDIRKQDVAFGQKLACDEIKLIFERLFGREQQ